MQGVYLILLTCVLTTIICEENDINDYDKGFQEGYEAVMNYLMQPLYNSLTRKPKQKEIICKKPIKSSKEFDKKTEFGKLVSKVLDQVLQDRQPKTFMKRLKNILQRERHDRMTRNYAYRETYDEFFNRISNSVNELANEENKEQPEKCTDCTHKQQSRKSLPPRDKEKSEKCSGCLEKHEGKEKCPGDCKLSKPEVIRNDN